MLMENRAMDSMRKTGGKAIEDMKGNQNNLFIIIFKEILCYFETERWF